MAQRGIREYDAKRMLARHLPQFSEGRFEYPGKVVLIDPETVIDLLPREHPWLEEERLVVKPDKLFGKRAKQGLVLLDASFDEAKTWIRERMNQRVQLGDVEGSLTHFIVEPFVPHEDEHYLAIKSERDGDRIHFSMYGGIHIEDNWDKVRDVLVPIGEELSETDLEALLVDVPPEQRDMLGGFISAAFRFYSSLGYSYLELNPFVTVGDEVVPLDAVARLDDTELFWHEKDWGEIEFPSAFGGKLSEAEQFIKALDEKTGASLKLTVLNPKGRLWTMIAGGGASVIYADTVADLGYCDALANYGEYSGNPNTEETYLYARTILDLMTREEDPRGKYLLIGGGIANFTDVAATFEGIVRALEEKRDDLRRCNVRVLVRRGGPNYRVGLEIMRDLGKRLDVPIEVYGPETHMTEIVSMALGEGKR
ncbi:MAG: ATP citrate lyase citrate-binding domain-containing protein [Anaerolineae bacterium]|jgi:ATP-citrate lyase beta-subunit